MAIGFSFGLHELEIQLTMKRLSKARPHQIPVLYGKTVKLY